MNRSLLLLLGCAIFPGCTTLPNQSVDGVAVAEIVQRLRCELASALPDVRGEYQPEQEFHWLKYWTAKVDLNLEVTDTGTIVPSTNIVEPLTQAVLPGVGAISRNFTLGLGGNFKGEAYRSDKISFTLSIDELMEVRLADECEFERRRGLLGELGLHEWVASALAPVANSQLAVGYHQAPGKAAQIADPGPSSQKSGQNAEKLQAEGTDPEAKKKQKEAREAAFAKAVTRMRAAERAIGKARNAGLMAENAAKNSKRIPRDRLGATYRSAQRANYHIKNAEMAAESAKILFWRAKIDKFGFPGFEEGEIKPYTERLKDIDAQVTAAKRQVDAAWELLPQDAPLDSITHSVKFTVTAGVNANPNWTLVRFRGPGLTPPFLSAQEQRIHELTVVLGAPQSPGSKTLSDEQYRQLLNQKFDSRGLFVVPSLSDLAR